MLWDFDLYEQNLRPQVNKMLVFSLPPVPRFASAGLPGSSAALPHLRSHSRCLKSIPRSHCDPAVDWGARRRVTAAAISACADITLQQIYRPDMGSSYLCMSAISPRSLSISSFSVAICLRSTCSREISSSCSVRISFSWWRRDGEARTEWFHLILDAVSGRP